MFAYLGRAPLGKAGGVDEGDRLSALPLSLCLEPTLLVIPFDLLHLEFVVSGAGGRGKGHAERRANGADISRNL